MKNTRLSLLLFSMLVFKTWCQPFAFVDLAPEMGIDYTGRNSGIAVADYDGDGYEDLYISVWNGPNRLLRNIGGQGFEEKTEEAGVALSGNSRASAWIDYDNDGFLDLYVSHYEAPDVLFRNNGDGTFADVTLSARIGNIGKPYSVNVVDYDNDGWLDIYVANFRSQNALFRNNGDGTFSNYIFPSGALDNLTNAMGALFFDPDLDGDQDLYLVHDGQTYIFYENNGRGSFIDKSVESGLAYTGFGMGVDAGDINRDGYPDVYVSNLYENNLFLNNGDGTFTDIAAEAGVADYGMGWGVSFLDYDNDGWQDLYLANDTWFSPYPNVLYRNKGDLTFEKVDLDGPVSSVQGSYGTAILDVNRDGFSDLVVANSGTGDHLQLFVNQKSESNWIGLRLESRESNRMAVGTRLRGKDSMGNWHQAALSAGSGFASQSSLQKIWGLGQAEQLDSLWIFWPSGQKQLLTNLSGRDYYHIIEGDEALPEKALVSSMERWEASRSDLGILFPNPVKQLLSIELRTEEDLLLSIRDQWGRELVRRSVKGIGRSPTITQDVSHLQPGLYRVVLKAPRGYQVLSVVKI